jgi:Retrotransposon gag protein
MAAAQIQQALIAHDRVRRTTDIPLFYGRKGKDTIEPQQYIERLERAATVAQWPDDQRRCDEFVLSLRDNALSWYSTLDNIIRFRKNVWDDLKKKFLEAYAPKYSAKALCICFQDLRQKNDETVQDFYNRVSTMFRNAYQSKPAHTTTYVGTLHGAITQAEADEIMGQGVTRMQLLMLNTMFLGGLKEEICNRVLKDGPTEPDASVKAAREIETILNDKRKEKGVFITSIEEEEEPEDGRDVGEVDEEEAAQLQAVNAILRKKGRSLYRFRVRPRGGSQMGIDGIGPRDGFNGTGAVICFFCNKPGHRIAQCRAKAAGRGRGGRGARG